MRKILIGLVIAALASVLTGTTQASTFVPSESTMTAHLGGISIGGHAAQPGTEGMVTLLDNGAGGHSIQVQPSVWNTVNYSAGTSLYTGIPLISDIRVTLRNGPMGTGTFADGFVYTNYLSGKTGVHNQITGLGGQSPLSGQLVLSILKGVVKVEFDLSLVGGPPGGVQSPTALGVQFVVTNGPWFTGPIPVTGITTNVVSWQGDTGAAITLHLTPEQHGATLTTGGGYFGTGTGLPMEYHTVTIVGTNELLSASQDGFIMIPSPQRIDTTQAVSGRVPGATWMRMRFVPEPGTLLLLVAGAVGVAVVGRRRMRK